MKKGDKVTIVPNENHEQHVKDNYGKIIEIEKIVFNSKNEPIYIN